MRKKSWITRNIFASGQENISMPVRKLSQNRAINEHFIYNKLKAKETFAKSFTRLNINQPFLDEATDIAMYAFETQDELLNIAEVNQRGIMKISELLDLRLQFKMKSDICNLPGRREDLLINICEVFNDRFYLNLEGGRTIYDMEYFTTRNISLHFMDNKKMRKTLAKEFNISILSLFAKYGADSLSDILHENSNFI